MLPRIATLVAAEGESLTAPALPRNLAEALGALEVRTEAWRWLEPGRVADVPLVGSASSPALAEALREALGTARIDLAVQPEMLRRKRLLLSDMDSTLIGQECIDEMADFAGCGKEVAAITERAMRGELDFEAALRARMQLLRGLPEAVLEQVWQERIRVTPGAATLMATMARLGAHCVLVSGGFTHFTERLRVRLGMEAQFANRLEVAEGVLTGEVLPPILGKEAKHQVLLAQALHLGISLTETLAVGDGANDLPMIEAAGLGVAYRAKPVVEAAASATIRHGDLTVLLSFQGIARNTWAQVDSA